MGIFIDNYQSTQLSNTEQSILLKLDSQPELLDNNLTQLAVELHSSGTSIIRLCQKLGFSGFSEFKFETKKLLSLTSNKHEISFLEELTNFCNFLSTDITTDKVRLFAQEISKSKTIYIAGVEASKSLAAYFSHKLNQFDYAAVHVSDDTLLDLLPNILNRHSLVIYVSISGQTKRLTNSAQKANHTGATVLSLTNAKSSPLGRLSKINISTNISTASYHNYDVTPRTFQVAVIDLILSRIVQNLEKQ